MTRSAWLVLAGTGCVTSLSVTSPSSITENAAAPAFTLAAHDGSSVTLATELARGPVVLVFYRGFW